MADTSSDRVVATGPWTIYVCPECGWYAPWRGLAETHAAVDCDPDSWPWVPVQVVPAGPPETMVELASAFRREAMVHWELAGRYDYDRELLTQYESMARAFEEAERRVRAALSVSVPNGGEGNG